MKNTFGNAVSVTLFGESHGAAIGAVLDGMPAGIPVDEGFIASQMAKRRSLAAISTARREEDRVEIVSGVLDGHTTGTPITFLIRNENAKSGDYGDLSHIARPGHADYAAFVKYHGQNDVRGGGHFSGRITAGLVAAGAVALSTLAAKGIRVGTHIARCAKTDDRPFGDLDKDIAALNGADFAVLDSVAAEKMIAAIEAAKAEGDSVGGILESAVTGLPAGIGEPWFDTLEGMLAHAIFSVPAVKGVEFGDGFGLCDLRGSEANGSLRAENGAVVHENDRMGGISGGISEGGVLRLRVAVKPTPSIYREQETVDFISGENVGYTLSGRHDPAIVHRARVAIDSCIALVLCDMLCQRYGNEYFAKM